MYIKQLQLENLRKTIRPGKVTVIYGSRRTGKTTLLREFVKILNESYLLLNGEDIFVQKELSSQSIDKLKILTGTHRYLIIDEAQKVPQIGLNLKLIIDHIPDIYIIATGSSSFDLARNTGEPLTGRKTTLKVFPLSQMELSTIESPIQTKAMLEHRMVYGSYPEVVLEKSTKVMKQYLRELVSSYLFKDILELDGIRH